MVDWRIRVEDELRFLRVELSTEKRVGHSLYSRHEGVSLQIVTYRYVFEHRGQPGISLEPLRRQPVTVVVECNCILVKDPGLLFKGAKKFCSLGIHRELQHKVDIHGIVVL